MNSQSETRLEPSRHAFRDWVIVAAYFVAVVVLAAALAPAFFHGTRWLVDWIAQAGLQDRPAFSYLHHHLGKADFTRVFNRSVLVAALVCLWPAMSMLSLTRRSLGLDRNPQRWRHLIVGFVCGSGLLLSMGAGYMAFDVFTWRRAIAWGSLVRESLLRAAGAGIVEEIVFRGAILGLLLRAGRPAAALIFVSTIFAAAHFLQAPASLEIREAVTWASGFQLAGQIVAGFVRWREFLLPEFATLWTAGFLLGWWRLRTRSLWLPIGLHAGWVFGIGFFAGMARASKPVRDDHLLPWIGETLKIGLVPLAVLALTGLLLAGVERGVPQRAGGRGRP
jgi:membrane protease YdiL (CAAX protease family)